MTEELIRAAAASVPAKVVTVVPEMEAWFFTAPEAIGRVLGKKVPRDMIALGKRDPVGVLSWLEGKSRKPWDLQQALAVLDDHDLQRIRALPEVAELCAFLAKVQQDDEAA
jgi:hypothetical protein